MTTIPYARHEHPNEHPIKLRNLGTMTLILGVLSLPLSFLLVGILLGIVAVILGHMALSSGDHRSMVVVGLTFGYISMIVVPVTLVVLALTVGGEA